ncbi:MAG TPA: peptidoglycan endopeptidase [Prosthecobacter sp.]|nr:peptidoglycan endopeptidase [Prosthecobacter sp.]
MPHRTWILPTLLVCLLSSCASSAKKRWEYEYNPGKTAIIINGKAVPPANLPPPVMKAITAGNRIVGKPYKYGGGHRTIEDWGYDCSGTVCYALCHAGLMRGCGTSDSLRNFGKKGEGKYMTIYARDGHTFIEIAGLRLDTGYNGQGRGPTWSTKSRPLKGYVARHPSGL